MKLVVASKNKNKIEEIKSIFTIKNIEWLSLENFPHIPKIVEDSESFQGNAVKKAVIVSLMTHCWTIADDSGLEVECLNGAPGVRSARYAGENSTDEENNKKLLNELAGNNNRKAAFCCVIAMASPGGRVQIVEGRCEGQILDVPRGMDGFGYDPLFMPDGFSQTFAEMPADLKNRISHRAMAIKRAELLWGSIFEEEFPDWPARQC
jgi:XTP/dITP diphosphohydrolase